MNIRKYIKYTLNQLKLFLRILFPSFILPTKSVTFAYLIRTREARIIFENPQKKINKSLQIQNLSKLKSLPFAFRVEPDTIAFHDSSSINIKNITVLDGSGVILYKDNVIHDNYIYNLTNSQLNEFDISRRFFIKNTINLKKAVILSTFGSQGYYHWMMEVISKLLYLIENKIDFKDFVLVFSGRRMEFHKDFFKLLGLNNEQVFMGEKSRPFKVNNAIVPLFPHPIGNPSQETLDLLNKYLVTSLEIGFQDEMIYISRKFAKKRKILNEKELDAILNRYNIKTVYLEFMNLEEQIQLFKKVKLVIGPHGAGFTNILFSKKGTIIVELFPKSYNNVSFYNLSNLIGANYYILEFNNDGIKNDSFCIDSNAVYNLLNDILNN